MKKQETTEMKVGMFGTGKILERLQNITDKKIEVKIYKNFIKKIVIYK